MAKARSLKRTRLTPIAAAAISSSRIAIQARPMREILEPLAGQDQERDESQADIVIGRRVDPEIVAEELRRPDAVQTHGAVGDEGVLRATIGTISPKPRVTIAR